MPVAFSRFSNTPITRFKPALKRNLVNTQFVQLVKRLPIHRLADFPVHNATVP